MEDDCTILSDRLKIKQILSNLISNGIKYTLEGSVTFKARMGRNLVVFDIDDTFACGWGSKNTYGLDVDTKSFTKCGVGTLLLTTALNGSVVNAGGDTRFGNALTCGVEIVEGEIACKERNSHNFLGPRTILYWVL